MLLVATFVTGVAVSQGPVVEVQDPGVRRGDGIRLAIIPGLTGPERELFQLGLTAFQTLNSVQGDAFLPGTESGLGPLFNMDSCAGCHAYPVTGGSSPKKNPQVEVGQKEGGSNRVPSFVKSAGPILQVRILARSGGQPDGQIAPLYTISGRRDAGKCRLAQADFEKELKRHNLAFRIPTPLFGAGLIEAISDESILENLNSNRDMKQRMGVAGLPNRDKNGSVTRFGWKAQIRTLEEFAAQAYLVEQGITSELYPSEYGNPPQECLLNATPEDRKNPVARRPTETYSNVTRVAHFMRFLAAPKVEAATPAVSRGQQAFQEIGCALCHTPQLRTGRSANPGLSEQTVDLYSDLLVHRMSTKLADGVTEGNAASDMFRTAPLWGLGQRLFLLHDGRTTDLLEAIEAHGTGRHRRSGRGRSEAELVVSNFRSLPPERRMDLLVFLRSL